MQEATKERKRGFLDTQSENSEESEAVVIKKKMRALLRRAGQQDDERGRHPVQHAPAGPAAVVPLPGQAGRGTHRAEVDDTS